MLIPFLISKIHNATVTGVKKENSTSIAIDADLIQKSGLREYQRVEIYNVSSGERFSTYVVAANKGAGDVILNGAVARLAPEGDSIIVAAYALLDERELNSLNSTILLMKENNEIERVITGKL